MNLHLGDRAPLWPAGLANTSGAEGARAERGGGGPLPSWPQPVLDALAESVRDNPTPELYHWKFKISGRLPM